MININVNKHPITITTDKFKVTITSSNVTVVEKKVRKVSTDINTDTKLVSKLTVLPLTNKLSLNGIPDTFTKSDLNVIAHNNKLGLKPTQVRAQIAGWVRTGKLIKTIDENQQVSYKKVTEQVL